MKLDLGCGDNKKKGFTGLNFPETSETDIVHDLTEFPYPFDENQVETLYCDNVLEHFSRDEISEIMAELFRICENGAELEIRVPHYMNENAMAGNHKSYFSSQSFDCYLRSHEYPVKGITQGFVVNDTDYIWRDQKIVSILRYLVPESWVRKFVPNTVDEVVFHLEVDKE